MAVLDLVSLRSGLFTSLIFSFNSSGNEYQELYSFNDTLGKYPNASLCLSGGTLYGMTSQGGKYDYGSIFLIEKSGTGFKDLFDFNGSNGALPNGSLVISGNLLYGMVKSGGLEGDGNIFKFNFK